MYHCSLSFSPSRSNHSDGNVVIEKVQDNIVSNHQHLKNNLALLLSIGTTFINQRSEPFLASPANTISKDQASQTKKSLLK